MLEVSSVTVSLESAALASELRWLLVRHSHLGVPPLVGLLGFFSLAGFLMSPDETIDFQSEGVRMCHWESSGSAIWVTLVQIDCLEGCSDIWYTPPGPYATHLGVSSL